MLNPAPRAGFDGNVPALGPPRLFDWTPIRLRLRGAYYGNSGSFVNWDDDFGARPYDLSVPRNRWEKEPRPSIREALKIMP
jgi:hypothetical protein